MKFTFKALVLLIVVVTFVVAFEPNSQLAVNSFILKTFGPVQSIDSVVSFPEKPSTLFVPASAVESKNGRSIVTLVKFRGLFSFEYASVLVQLGEPRENFVEIFGPNINMYDKVVTFKIKGS